MKKSQPVRINYLSEGHGASFSEVKDKRIDYQSGCERATALQSAPQSSNLHIHQKTAVKAEDVVNQLITRGKINDCEYLNSLLTHRWF